jgi:hypothetical protein
MSERKSCCESKATQENYQVFAEMACEGLSFHLQHLSCRSQNSTLYTRDKDIIAIFETSPSVNHLSIELTIVYPFKLSDDKKSLCLGILSTVKSRAGAVSVSTIQI